MIYSYNHSTCFKLPLVFWR